MKMLHELQNQLKIQQKKAKSFDDAKSTGGTLPEGVSRLYSRPIAPDMLVKMERCQQGEQSK